MTVPIGQLLQGAGRGRWGYRGPILYRITDSVLLDADTIGRWVNIQTYDTKQKNGDNNAERCDGFRLMCEGDLVTINFSNQNDDNDGSTIHNTEFSCLDSLTDLYIRNKSKRIVENLYLIPLDEALSRRVSGYQMTPKFKYLN